MNTSERQDLMRVDTEKGAFSAALFGTGMAIVLAGAVRFHIVSALLAYWFVR